MNKREMLMILTLIILSILLCFRSCLKHKAIEHIKTENKIIVEEPKKKNQPKKKVKIEQPKQEEKKVEENKQEESEIIPPEEIPESSDEIIEEVKEEKNDAGLCFHPGLGIIVDPTLDSYVAPGLDLKLAYWKRTSVGLGSTPQLGYIFISQHLDFVKALRKIEAFISFGRDHKAHDYRVVGGLRMDLL